MPLRDEDKQNKNSTDDESVTNDVRDVGPSGGDRHQSDNDLVEMPCGDSVDEDKTLRGTR